MAALSEWLAPLPMPRFIEQHLGRLPFAQPASASGVVPNFGWQMLDALLRARPPDVLVVAQGKLVEEPPPVSLQELRSLFERGLGIAIRAPEKAHEGLRGLASEFAADLPGEQRVIVFATPGGTHGFSWHYDAEDVFIVQTAGDKEYYLRQNTVRPPPERGFQSDFREFRHETSAVAACRLLPGDVLYVPKGFWHIAHAHADSLSLSIGVFPELRS